MEGIVSELGETVPLAPAAWLTSFWGFDPSLWGGVGFTKKVDRDAFLRAAPAGALLAIYVTKQKGPKAQRGKLVGFLEITHEIGPMQDFTSPVEWAAAEKEAGKKGKWVFGIKASRAWQVVEDDWKDVDTFLPETYFAHNKQLIGSKGVPISAHEIASLGELNVREVSVFGQMEISSEWIGPLNNALLPSPAVPQSKTPVLHKEADGPKRLYILALQGNQGHFLARAPESLLGQLVIKVGFSVSPADRRNQIQSAYPAKCAFQWEVVWQYPPLDQPAYPNADVAIAGENAMKKRLAEEGECIGGEFFVADEGLLIRTMSIGKFASNRKMETLCLQPVATPN